MLEQSGPGSSHSLSAPSLADKGLQPSRITRLKDSERGSAAGLQESQLCDSEHLLSSLQLSLSQHKHTAFTPIYNPLLLGLSLNSCPNFWAVSSPILGGTEGRGHWHKPPVPAPHTFGHWGEALCAEAAKNSSDAKNANPQNWTANWTAQVTDTGGEALIPAGSCRRERLIPKCTGRSWQ